MVTPPYLPPMSTKQKHGLPNPVTSSPVFRRRRAVWFLLVCVICAFVFFSSPTSFHPLRLFGSSPAELSSLHRDVLELHGLQHFVLNSDLSLHDVLYKANRDRPQGVPVHDHDDRGGTSDPEHDRLDPTKEIDLKVYSSFDGDDNWVKHVRELEKSSPLVVFSKVRPGVICPSPTKNSHITVDALHVGLPSSNASRSLCSYSYLCSGNGKLMLIFNVVYPYHPRKSRIAHIRGAPRVCYKLMLSTPLPG